MLTLRGYNVSSSNGTQRVPEGAISYAYYGKPGLRTNVSLARHTTYVLGNGQSLVSTSLTGRTRLRELSPTGLNGALLLQQARLTCNVSLDRHTTYALCNGQSLGSSELNREDPFKGMSRPSRLTGSEDTPYLRDISDSNRYPEGRAVSTSRLGLTGRAGRTPAYYVCLS